MALNSDLQTQLSHHHIQVSPDQLQQLQTYIELLQKWNRVYNLVGDTTLAHLIDRHIIDSLLVRPYIHGQRILDVGTGAGLPGIPLAIMLPNFNFVLLDSNGKKTRFITQVKLTLNLKNVEVVNQRVETYQPHELFDIITSRAFANLMDMLQITQHLCKPQGEWIALKGDDVQPEINALAEVFVCKRNERLPFADKNIHRQIVIVSRT